MPRQTFAFLAERRKLKRESEEMKTAKMIRNLKSFEHHKLGCKAGAGYVLYFVMFSKVLFRT